MTGREDAVPRLEDILEEDRRVWRVRVIADFTCAVIAQSRPRRREAEALVSAARQRILALFPGREDTYEIVYGSRFRRVLDEYSRPDDDTPVWRGPVM